MAGVIHIIGAGLSGLSAATALAEKGRHVVVYEGSSQAGGRCRSYHDDTFGAVIDNGNHLLLSGNDMAMAYLKRIGGASALTIAKDATFHFTDFTSGERWTIAMNRGRFPFWLFNKKRRVPGTKLRDYQSVLKLAAATDHETITSLLNKNTQLYKRLWHTLFVSALNTDPEEASAKLAGAILMGSLVRGGWACRPIVADGLSAAFIDPALSYLEAHGGEVHLQHRLRQLQCVGDNAIALDFGAESVMLGKDDKVVLAVPPWVAQALLPDISAPDEYRAILNAHFRITPPAGWPQVMGVIGAKTEWIFAFPDRISTTISNADRFMGEEREALAASIWAEVSRVTGLAPTLPPWQIVKEKRATFAATPGQDDKRPKAETQWRNVWLAGDWVQTGLPATIEGAIRSGKQAAERILSL